ncbi:MAG: hypothetical protein CEE41_03995 [Hadesarchaea archaeon B3_Hades]|nr:MAG: hypothetical protein CEE41_03995 [Hadesarchaea archaeon B3_Hades]
MRGKSEECKDWKGGMPPGGAARVAVSIVVGVGWLIFLILFLAFYAEDFSVYWNLAIVFASLLVMCTILGPMWAYWGIKTGRARKKPPGGAAKVAVSTVVGVGWSIFLILFLAFYAEGFSIYENLAIVLASLLVVGAIRGPMWAYWGIKTGRARKKPPGLAPRVAVSTVVGCGWMIFLIVFLAFYAEGFSVYRNLATILVSLLVMCAILGPMWASWGISVDAKTGRARKKRPGLALRTAVSTVVGCGWLIFFILFLVFYAEDFSIYRNLATILVSLLVVGAILGPIWASWGITIDKKTGRARKKRPGLALRTAVSTVVGCGWLIFFILFLVFYAEDFSIYRNLAIILVSLLVVVVIEVAMWAPWAMKTGRARKKRMRKKRR